MVLVISLFARLTFPGVGLLLSPIFNPLGKFINFHHYIILPFSQVVIFTIISLMLGKLIDIFYSSFHGSLIILMLLFVRWNIILCSFGLDKGLDKEEKGGKELSLKKN